MGALSELSSNRQSPMGNFKPNSGYRQLLSYHRIADENSFSNKTRPRMTDHAPKSTSVTAPETLESSTPKSKLPVRASTPTSLSCNASQDRASVASVVNKAGIEHTHIATLRKRKEGSRKPQPLFHTPLKGSRYLTPPSKRQVTLVAKPLPSPPIAQVVTNTPENQGRCLIDASEKPLRRSPGTPEEEEWPTLTPAVRSSSPSTARNVNIGTQHHHGHSALSEDVLSASSAAPALPSLGENRSAWEGPDISPCGTKGCRVNKLDQAEAGSEHTGKTMVLRNFIPEPVASQLGRSPSSLTIGKAITSSEPTGQHHRQKVSQSVGDNSVANAAAAEEPDSTTGILGYEEPPRAEGVTGQRFITSFSRPRVVDCVAESENPICLPRSRVEPPGSPFAAPSKPHGPGEMQSPGKVTEDESLAPKVELGTPDVISVHSRSKLPRLSQVGDSVSTPRKATSRLGSKHGGPLNNDPLLVFQLKKAHSTDGAPEIHGSISGVDTRSEGIRNMKLLPHDMGHESSHTQYPESVTPSGEAVWSTCAPGEPPVEFGKRIKRLSASPHAPDLGPTLTISDDAEVIIMGVRTKTDTIRTNVISTKVRRLSQDLQRSAILNGLWKTPKQGELLNVLRNDDTSRPASPASSQRPELLGGSASSSMDRQKDYVHGSSLDVEDLEHDNAGAWVGAKTATMNSQNGKTRTVKSIEGQENSPVNEDHAIEPPTFNRAQTRENKRSLSPHPNILLGGHGDVCSESVGDRDLLGTGLDHGPKSEVQGPIASQSMLNSFSTPPPRTSLSRLSSDAIQTLSVTSAAKPRSAGASEASTRMDGPAVPSKGIPSIDHLSRLPRYNPLATGRSFSRTSRRDSGDVTSIFSVESPRRDVQRHVVDARLSHNLMKASDALHPAEPVVGLTAGTKTLDALESRNPRARDSVTEDLSNAPRSKSRTRLAMSKLGGLFHMRSKSSGKAAAKGAHDRKQKGGTTNNPLPPFNFPLGVSEPKSQTMQMPRTKLGSESPRLQRIRRPYTAHQDLNPSSAPTRQSKDVSEATAMAMAIMEQARSEKDSPQKDKLVSLAAVMVDAITNARDAQRFMHTAQQAAKDARLSYDLTQRSIAEIGRLVKESGPTMDLSIFRRLQSD